jgi:hypothetical protein
MLLLSSSTTLLLSASILLVLCLCNNKVTLAFNNCTVAGVNIPNVWTGNITLSTDLQYTLAYRVLEDKLFIYARAYTTGWVGFGLSERGHMLGSDIVTFYVDKDGIPAAHDRFVNWVAYPFVNVSDGRPYPTIDDCEDWTLLCASEANGFTEALLVRALTTGDGFDRNITNTDQAVVWAVSPDGKDDIAYHTGSNRGSTRINFFTAPLSSSGNANFTAPSDATSYIDVSYSWITTASDTVYTLKSFDLGTTEYHAVAYEFLWLSTAAKKHVHHTILHDCGNTTGAPYTTYTGGPTGGGSVLNQGTCKSFLYVSARGSENQLLPAGVGFRIGGKYARYSVLEFHIDNPDKIVGDSVTAGIRIHVTTNFRIHDAGTMSMGFASGATIPAGQESATYVNTCPKECTSKFAGPINVFQSFLHEHSVGKSIWSEKFSASGVSQGIVNSNQYWNAAFQTVATMNYVLSPNETINTWCVYDTTKQTVGVPFSTPSSAEMCFDFIAFYPAANGLTYCGRNGALSSDVTCGSSQLTNVAPQYASNLHPDFPLSLRVGFNLNGSCAPTISTPVPTLGPNGKVGNSTSSGNVISSNFIITNVVGGVVVVLGSIVGW